MVGVILASLFASYLVYFARKDKPMGSGFSGFGDVIGTAPPRKTASDILKVITSSKLEHMDADDLLTLYVDAQQALVRPNMTMEESVHVRQTLLTIALSLHDTGVKGVANGANQ